MAQLTLNVPNADAADVLAALEAHHSKEASRVFPNYSSLTPTNRAAACIAVYLRSITKSYRRGQEVRRRREQEAPIVVAEPDVT